MTKVAVVLSGCGVYDGAEIHESVLTLLALDRLGAEVVCAAPDVPQMHVVDHLTGEPVDEARNVLVESARIARGEIRDLASMSASDVDAVVLPGGFGAAKNLCGFANGEDDWEIETETARFLREMRAAGKPIGAVCIAPAVIGRVFAEDGVKVTIGNDKGTASRLTAKGARHEDCAVDEICVDEERRIVTSPAYMLATRISEAAAGIDRVCETVVRWAQTG